MLFLEPLEERALLDASGFASDSLMSLPQASAAFVPGEILVKLRERILPATFPAGALARMGPWTADVPQALSSVLLTSGATSITPVFPQAEQLSREWGTATAMTGVAADLAAETATDAERAELDRWYQLDLPADTDIPALRAAVSSLADVELAEPNYEWGLDYEIPPVIAGLPDGTTDPDYDEQWFHNNAGIWQAWNYLNTNGVYPGGKHDVVVAVIDTGVDYTHEELAANMWVNPGETPGNGIDDDRNGFVDDIHGVSVVSNTGSHTGDPVDYQGHGTHVAGIIAAQAFNGRGGVGVAFNTQIMAIRAAQYSGTLTVQDVAEGVLYAADNGADVINMSFGGYSRSQIVEDALAVALNQAVLVAAAGNDGIDKSKLPHYPSAIPWVLGVEATTAKNKLADFSNTGYEVRAPGVSIYSTLPGNQYASWSGTSMATPVISGIAALMRSYFWQRDIYSSRFIMGSIAASRSEVDKGGTGGVANAYTALTEPPKPGVMLYENWLFDQTTIAARNDGDGRADAGETLHLAIEVINRSGLAENVTATLAAQAEGVVLDDPYVTITTDTVSFGNIGPFALSDNGLIWNTSGVITGVEHPFVVTIDPSCPNDHVIPFVLTTTFQDGWDENHASYTRVDRFNYIVQRGVNLPSVISQNMTLTADNFWIVGGPVLVEPGATLTVEPGTQIQWGAISSDPYNPGPQTGYLIVRGALRVQGTEDRPVELFPSYLVSGQTVDIRAESGNARLAYVKVRNPQLTNLYSIDHGYLDWDLYASTVEAWYISNTIFHQFRGGGSLTANYQYDTVLFDAGWLAPSAGAKLTGSVLLQDNENNRPISYSPVLTYDESWYPADSPSSTDKNLIIEHNGYTYATMQSGGSYLQAAELAAEYLGGEVVSIPNADEQFFLSNYFVMWAGLVRERVRSLMGLRPLGAGEFEWSDGSPTYFTWWWPGSPVPIKGAAHSEGVWFSYPGGWDTMSWINGIGEAGWYLIRVPGRWTKAEINAPFLDGRIDAYITARLEGVNRDNAFLSKYWDPNLNHWMRINSPSSGTPLTAHVLLEDNFWGTTTTALIDHDIIDYNDNFTTARVDYGPPLEHGSETTYPFVESVLINGIPADQVPEVGAGPATFTVTFNRDMDPTVQPFVAFGPAAPFTDYTVHPVGGNDAGYNRNAFDFTVRLSQPASQAVTVAYATEDGTARAGVDYEATSGKLTFEPGETEKIVPVRILGDIDLEPDKTFQLRLSEPTVATLADALGVGTIVDDELVLSIDDVTLWEGNDATTQAVFTVTLSAPASELVSVSYETVDGTAESLTDYQATVGTVTLAPGETSKTISIPVRGNTANQPDRTFSVQLMHPRIANLADALGQATIRDDDFLLAADEVRFVEGNTGSGAAVVTVRLSGSSDQTVTVGYATADGTATAGSDYQAASGTLTFPPGVIEQTFPVTIFGDTTVEPNETFTIQFSQAVRASLVSTQVQGTIVGDDGPLLSIDDVTVVEGDTGSTDAIFTVRLSADPTTAVSVAYTTPNVGTATLGTGLGADYGGVTGTLTFTPGGALQQTIRVPVAGDGWGEDDEDFLVILASTTAAISDHTGRATIVNDDPYFELDDAVVVEGDSGTTNAVFLIRLVDCPASETVTVGYATVSGSARAGEDFIAQSGTVTFVAGQLPQQTITVPILGDTIDELDEDFQILLSTPSGAIIFDYVARGTITNDDRPTLHIDDVTRPEGAAGVTAFDFTVCLSHAAAETVTVDYATNDGTATADGDYRAAAGTVTFQPGETEQTVTVQVKGDQVNEFDEFFRIELFAPVYATLADGQAIGTILDDDNPVLTIADVSVIEGASGTTVAAVLTVTLSPPSSETVTVDYATADGTATAGTDYQARNGTLTFLPGETLQSITVTVFGDDDPDINETFTVQLSGAANATCSDPQGLATIVGDDGPLLEIVDNPRVEGDSGTSYLEFTVRLSAAVASNVQVSYATADGTARAGTDYGAASGILIFQSGQTEKTVLVPVLGDLQNESDETFFVRLSNATVVAIADAEAVGTIVDDDPVITIADVSVTEGSGGQTPVQFTVSLSRRPVAGKPVTVRYATADGTAVVGSDYLQVAGTLGFTSDAADPLDKTVTIIVQGDLVNEVDERFFLNLSDVSGAELTDSQGQATILDDDGPKLLISDATVAEGDAGETSLVFTISLSQASALEITVDYSTVDGAAVAGLDYRSTRGTFTFLPNQTSQTISVPVIGDLVDETDETLLVTLSGGSGTPLADASGQGIIVDDDTAALRVNDVRQAEGFDGWLNSRTWQGVFWVTPMTGESYHELRISGAVAADDPWLVSGYDVGRFRFQVKTMGVEAMTLQAAGEEGSIHLTWAQDDFELLAGYHLYRAASASGPYTRLNQTIIPIGQESYVDGNVTPAVPMFYRFTVVQTDMAESDFSNVVSAASLDTIAPVIGHAPKTAAPPDAGLRLTATVTDNVSVAGVAVHYRARGSTVAYVGLAMVNISDTSWSATIPGSEVQSPGVEYYLTATDGINTVYHGTAAAPHSVVVNATPSLSSVSPYQGPLEGGTRVTLAGQLFQNGATVQFGGVPATDVVVQTSNQILCTTPAHFPAQVDVRVINPDATEATRLSGFRYVDDDAVVSLPVMSADHGARVDLPVSISNVDGLLAASVTITFDPGVLQVRGVSTGTLTSGWLMEVNTGTAGRVTILLASAMPVSGSGTLAKIDVEAVGAAATQTPLTIASVELNDGAIQPDLSDGLFSVIGFFTISGSVKYFQDNRFVPGTQLELVGVGVHATTSDSTGQYSFPTIQTGSYTLTPAKNDEVREITAYDASLVLRKAAGLLTLTPLQTLAADVNRSGAVTAMDAVYILQKSVDLLPGLFPGAGKYWDFSPAELAYPLVNGDLTNQNFTAILIGDVSGNWVGASGAPQGAETLGDSGPVSATLTLPDVVGQSGGLVAVPLRIARGGADVYSLDLSLAYDTAQLSLVEVSPGEAAAGFSWLANTQQAGVIQIGMAGASVLSRDGDLLTLSFLVTGSLATPAAVSFQSVALDEGAVPAVLDAGWVADATPPEITLTPRLTNDSTPSLSGTIDDALAVVTVTVAGKTYAASNCGDGTWTLNDNTISPPLVDDSYDVQVQGTDVLSRVGLDSTTHELTIDTRSPTIATLAPADDATRVAPNVKLVLTFGEDIRKGTGQLVLKKSADHTAVETIMVTNDAVAVSGTMATIDLVTMLAESTGYYVEVAAGAFEDLAGNSFAGISGASTWNFTVAKTLAEVVDRMVFYNNSYYDGNNAAANLNDFNAIAPHITENGGHGPHPTGKEQPTKELGKDALLPGQTATFANYTNFGKGLNGIMVDIAGLAGTLTVADFQFKIGNTNNPTTWVTAPAPTSVTVFAGKGTPDALGVASDRITLIWADKVIQKTWMQVTVLATAGTGLAQSDVFYFGNAPGESGAGNTATYAFVTVTDELAARNYPHGVANRALVSDPYDYSKDSFVTVTDELLTRNNATNMTNALRLIVVPALLMGGADLTTFASLAGLFDVASPLTQPAVSTDGDMTPAFDVSPLTPTLAPGCRSEGVRSSPVVTPSATRDQVFAQLARGFRGRARSQAMPWASWEESESLLSAKQQGLVSDADLQLLDDVFASY